jgi:hypothetical protein
VKAERSKLALDPWLHMGRIHGSAEIEQECHLAE